MEAVWGSEVGVIVGWGSSEGGGVGGVGGSSEGGGVGGVGGSSEGVQVGGVDGVQSPVLVQEQVTHKPKCALLSAE